MLNIWVASRITIISSSFVNAHLDFSNGATLLGVFRLGQFACHVG